MHAYGNLWQTTLFSYVIGMALVPLIMLAFYALGWWEP